MSVRYNPQIVTNGLLLCLDAGNAKSYIGSGTTWNDLSGRNNIGTLTNGLTYSNASGGSIMFDGVDDYINISPTNFNLSTFSINVWFKSLNTSSNNLRLIHKADTSGSTKGFLIANSAIDGKMVFGYQASYTTNEILKRSTVLISQNTWYCVTMTYSGSSGIKIYFNSIEDTGESSTSPDIGWTSSSGNFFSVGSVASGDAYFYDGSISQISIYNKVLTSQEVRQNFNALRGRFGI